MEEEASGIAKCLPLITDRITTRVWELDLSLAGMCYSPKIRPAKRRRQKIARFVERDETIERFAIQQTIPYCGHEVESPPTQAQYGAVHDFFVEPCETRYQANTLLSARDYAKIVADDFSFTTPRKRLIWLCTTAFILADKDLRSLIRTWYVPASRRGTVGSAGTAPYRKAHKKIEQFASRLIDDMRAEGAEVFG